MIMIIIFKIMPLINALKSVNLKDYIRQHDVRKSQNLIFKFKTNKQKKKK